MKQRNQSGDTLVEVAIAIAMMGLVVTTVFMVTNRSLATIMDAAERTAVRASINSQLELIEYLRDRKPSSDEWKKVMDLAKLADPAKDSKLVDEIYHSDCTMHTSTAGGSVYSSIWFTYDHSPEDDRFVRLWNSNNPGDSHHSEVLNAWKISSGDSKYFQKYSSVSFDKSGVDGLKQQISTAPIPGHGLWVDIVKSKATKSERDGYYIEAIVRACWTPLGSRKPGEGRIKVIKRFSVMGDELR